MRYEASLEAEAMAGGFRGKRPYAATASASLRYTAIPDTSAGRATLAFRVDSLAFTASDRDGQERRYMEERLRRYTAELSLSRSGQVLSLAEEPDLPPLEFSPVSFGRMLVYALPALPAGGVSVGTEWTLEQPLLDKFHPEAKVVKTYRAKAIRQGPQGRLLECAVEARAFLEEGLASGPPDAPADSMPPGLEGRGEAVFDLERGLPVASVLELEGRFVTPPPRAPGDSAAAADLPLRLKLHLSLRFDH